MHLTEDFRISSRVIRKTFCDEQKMNPNSARNIWQLLARTRPEPDPNPTRKTRPDSNCVSGWYVSRPTFCFSTHEYSLFTSFVFTYRVLVINSCILWTCLVVFRKWPLHNFSPILFMLHLCQVWFSKLLIEWVFLEQGGTRWYCGTHKWYAIRKSSGTTV